MKNSLRIVYTEQRAFGQVPIAEVAIDFGTRDDIPAVLKGIQRLYCNIPVRERVFAVLEECRLASFDCFDERDQAAAKLNSGFGRPGMHLWIGNQLVITNGGCLAGFAVGEPL